MPEFAVKDPKNRDNFLLLINEEGDIRSSFDTKEIAQQVQQAYTEQRFIDGRLPVTKEEYDAAMRYADDVLEAQHTLGFDSFRDIKDKSSVVFLLLLHIRNMPGYAKLGLDDDLKAEAKKTLLEELVANRQRYKSAVQALRNLVGFAARTAQHAKQPYLVKRLRGLDLAYSALPFSYPNQVKVAVATSYLSTALRTLIAECVDAVEQDTEALPYAVVAAVCSDVCSQVENPGVFLDSTVDLLGYPVVRTAEIANLSKGDMLKLQEQGEQLIRKHGLLTIELIFNNAIKALDPTR